MKTKNYIQKYIKQEIKKKGKSIILVSGGKSVKKILFQLSRVQLDWSSVEVYFIDERKVKKNNINSNFYAI